MKDFLINEQRPISAIHGGHPNGLKAKKYQTPSIEIISLNRIGLLQSSVQEGNIVDPRETDNTLYDNQSTTRPNFTGEITPQAGNNTWLDFNSDKPDTLRTGF